LHRDPGGGAFDLAEVVGRQRDGSRPDVLVEATEFLVPGMGTIHGFWASSQASATCAGVAFFRSAILASRSTRAWFAFSASGMKRGMLDDQALVSRGMTLTVADRARAPIIGLRYGLSWYFAR
jgi:hypothetical protein